MKQKIIIIIIISSLSVIYTKAQSKYAIPKQDIEKVVRSVADNIIDETSFKIINKKTEETFAESDNLPVAKEFVLNPYNVWKYKIGVLNISMLKMGEILNDESYTNYAKRNVSFAFDHDNYFKKKYDAGLCKSEGMLRKFRMKSLDDCGAMGAGILAVYETDPQQRYLDYLNKASDYILNEEFRLEDGVFIRDRPYKMTIWGDDLYMSVPFLARMGDLTKEGKYFDEAANQVILFNKYLWDPQVRLFFHCWYDDIQQNGVAHWSRCNGWMMMAQIELLDKLPTDHPKREELIQLMTRQIIGLSPYQNETGLWHQLNDRNDTFLEKSSKAMFTYAIAKAINEGWLDARYADIAFRGWEGLSTKIRADGQVEGICRGTGLNSTTHFYNIRPTPLNDIHGLGPVLFAGSEMLRLIDYLSDFEK